MAYGPALRGLNKRSEKSPVAMAENVYAEAYMCSHLFP